MWRLKIILAIPPPFLILCLQSLKVETKGNVDGSSNSPFTQLMLAHGIFGMRSTTYFLLLVARDFILNLQE